MRRRARASHLTRRPIHSSLLLQIEDSRSGPRAWSRHLQLAYAILSLELAVPEENSRVILISALQAAHDCAKRIDQLAGDGVQLQIRRDVCERLGRVAKCAKRAPAELRRRLDRAIAPLIGKIISIWKSLRRSSTSQWRFFLRILGMSRRRRLLLR